MSDNKDIVDAIYNEYEPYIRKVCFYKLKDLPDKIDDCVQETFKILLEALNSGTDIKNPKAWLTSVAINVIKDTYKELDKENSIIDFSCEALNSISFSNTDEDRIFAVDDEQILMYKERIIMLLNDDERSLIHDKYTLKKSIKLMAAERNTTENNMYQKFTRLKHKIRMLIQKVLYS